jgi:hypothetical protein
MVDHVIGSRLHRNDNNLAWLTIWRKARSANEIFSSVDFLDQAYNFMSLTREEYEISADVIFHV